MLPLFATSLATTAAALIFGAAGGRDVHRLFFVFPTYQITSFKFVSMSISRPPWIEMFRSTSLHLTTIFSSTSCNNKGKWRCLLWDWEGFIDIINRFEMEVMQHLINPAGHGEGHDSQPSWNGRGIMNHEPESPRIFSRILTEFFRMELSAVILAGVAINNTENSFGAQMQKAILDIYHENWDGKLYIIGSVQNRVSESDALFRVCDKSSAPLSEDAASESYHESGTFVDSPKDALHLVESRFVNKTGSCTEHEAPSFSIPARQIFRTPHDAISILLANISPKTLLSMAFQLLQNRLILRIPSSAVIHFKTSNLVAATAGAICVNELRITPPSVASILLHDHRFPWVSIEHSRCRIDWLTTGWGNMTKIRGELSQTVWKRHGETGSVL